MSLTCPWFSLMLGVLLLPLSPAIAGVNADANPRDEVLAVGSLEEWSPADLFWPSSPSWPGGGSSVIADRPQLFQGGALDSLTVTQPLHLAQTPDPGAGLGAAEGELPSHGATPTGEVPDPPTQDEGQNEAFNQALEETNGQTDGQTNGQTDGLTDGKIEGTDNPQDLPEYTMDNLVQAVVAEMNQVRANPQSYLPVLRAWRDRFQADGKTVVLDNGSRLSTFEGLAAVDEALGFLEQAQPVSDLRLVSGLSRAAQDQVDAQGATGATGHDGSKGGMRERIERHGTWQITIGENISYGATTGQQVVMQLIIDDGVPGRGHRTNIFNPKFQVTGVACGDHANYRTMCVLTYAGGYVNSEGSGEVAGDAAATGETVATAIAPAIATDHVFTVEHRGTVALDSLRFNDQELLPNGSLKPGETLSLTLTTCEGNLRLQLTGYSALPWSNLNLCRFKTLIIDANNSMRLGS